MRKTFVGWFFTAIFCGDWLSLCAGAFSESAHDPSSPWFSPSCSSPSSRTPHVLEFPRGLAQEPVLFENRFSISGGQLPVLFLPGRFNLISIAFVYAWRNCFSWLLPRTRTYFVKYWYAVFLWGWAPFFVFFFFCEFLWALFALLNFFCSFSFFLRVTRGTTMKFHMAGVVSLICWRVDSHHGPAQELESAG